MKQSHHCPRGSRGSAAVFFCLLAGWSLSPAGAAEPAVVQSAPMRLLGYEQTVTIKATPAELSEFLNDPSRSLSVFSSGLSMEEGEKPAPVQEPPGLGGCLPAPVKLLGMEIPGWLMLVRVEKDRLLWVVWDNPFIFHLQRWRSSPVEEGTRLTLKMDSEAPREGWLGFLADVLQFERITRIAYAGVDLMLAKIQANFDPGLDAEKLVAVGLRGRYYETLVQVHETEVEIAADLATVKNRLLLEKNQGLRLVEPGNACLYGSIAPGASLSCPAALETGNGELAFETFSLEQDTEERYTRRVYFVVVDQVGYFELDARGAGRRTRLKLRFLSEIPGATSSAAMAWLAYVNGVPPRLEALAAEIKSAMEGV